MYLIASSAILSWSIRYFQTCSFLSHTVFVVEVLREFLYCSLLPCLPLLPAVYLFKMYFLLFSITFLSSTHLSQNYSTTKQTRCFFVLSFLCSFSLHCQPHHLCLSSLFCLPLFHLLFAATLLPVIVCLSRVLLGTSKWQVLRRRFIPFANNDL